MTAMSKDDGVITALLIRLKQQRIPRVLALQDKVSNGDLLNEMDIDFLYNVYQEAKRCHEICKHRHEFDDLFCRVTHFYHEVAQAALDNEAHLH